jgi:uroporphyrinogen decarboxylase
MDGLARKGIIATGAPKEVAQAAADALCQSSDRFILRADCTIPGDTNWDNLRAAISTAQCYR